MSRSGVHQRLALFGFAAAVCLVAGAATAGAQDLTVAAASDLQAVMPDIVTLFQKHSGRTVRTTYGSSGNFYTQIQNGAPFDVYFSADIDYPRRLERAGLTDPGSLHTYAVGQLVLWTAKSSGIDIARGLPMLLEAAVRRVAIANPEHAPYGRAAVAALRSAGLYERIQPKLVLGENISQAAQFVQSGNAQAGILAMSVARAPAMLSAGSYVELPRSSYPAIEQAAVVLRSSKHLAVAREFLAFFKREEVTRLLERFGFQPPAGAR